MLRLQQKETCKVALRNRSHQSNITYITISTVLYIIGYACEINQLYTYLTVRL